MEQPKRKIWPYILLGVMIALFLTTVTGKAKSVTYDPETLTEFAGNGITVQLPEASAKKRNRDVTFYCMWEEGLLICGKNTEEQIEAAGYDPDMPLEEYAAICMQDANAAGEVFTDDYGNVCFTYEVPGNENSLYYYVTVKRGEDTYWICNFVCELELKDTYETYFPLWASTIEVE